MVLYTSVEDRIKGANLFYEDYLKGYRERVENYYSIENSKSKCFKLVDPVLITMVFFKKETYVIFSSSDSDKLVTITATEEQNTKLIELTRAPGHKLEEYILSLTLIKSNIIGLNNLRDISGDAPIWFNNLNHLNLPKQSYHWGEKKADWDYNLYQFENSFKRAIEPSSTFPLFDLESIFNKVNNNQFKYELEEAVKAYNAGLFLASTITAAVSLETLLKSSVISKLGEEYLPKKDNQKYTLNYAQILLENKQIDERLNHRIRSINELRRGGAHSKTGEIEQWDAEQVISGIKIIVESIFKETN